MELQRPVSNTSPHTHGRPEPKHVTPGEARSPVRALRGGRPRGRGGTTPPQPVQNLLLPLPLKPKRPPRAARGGKPSPGRGSRRAPAGGSPPRSPPWAPPSPRSSGAAGRGEARRGPPRVRAAPRPAAHRHQELQRPHVVPLGLEQLVEDADAQAKLLLQVLAAFPLAFPFAFLCHGAARRNGAPSPAPFPAAGSAA